MLEMANTLNYEKLHIALKLSKNLEDEDATYDDLILRNHYLKDWPQVFE